MTRGSEFDPPAAAVAAVVEAALAEDLLPMGDITASLVPPAAAAATRLVARAPGVLAGTLAAATAYGQLDPSVSIDWRLGDGATLEAGSVIATLCGPLRSVVTGERTALNLLCHLSGVATATRRLVEAVEAANPACRVRDTRKTTPGLRALEKAAVRAGGGVNHRANLSEGILLKDNHLGGVGIAEAVAQARRRWPGRHVEVECDHLGQAMEAVEAKADMVMFDNMTPVQVGEAVLAVRRAPGGDRVLIEVSGGVSLETAPAYAAAGVDFVSVGAITHSAPILDIGLDLG